MKALNFEKMIRVLMRLKSVYSAVADGEMSFEIKDVCGFSVRVKDGKAETGRLSGKADVSLSLLDAENLFFGVWKFVCGRGAKLPAFAETWFPLPFFLGRPDFV